MQKNFYVWIGGDMPAERLATMLRVVGFYGSDHVCIITNNVAAIIANWEDASELCLVNCSDDSDTKEHIAQFKQKLLDQHHQALKTYEFGEYENISFCTKFQQDLWALIKQLVPTVKVLATYRHMMTFMRYASANPMNYGIVSDVLRYMHMYEYLSSNPDDTIVYLDSDITYVPSNDVQNIAGYLKQRGTHFLADIKHYTQYKRGARNGDRYRVCNDFLAASGSNGKKVLERLLGLLFERVVSFCNVVQLRHATVKHLPLMANPLPPVLLEPQIAQFKNNRPQGSVINYVAQLSKEHQLCPGQLHVLTREALYLRYALTMHITGPLLLCDGLALHQGIIKDGHILRWQDFGADELECDALFEQHYIKNYGMSESFTKVLGLELDTQETALSWL